ncbi:radical SAM protein [Thiobaca trueperi]|uniref:Pyruvate-formate lyase-activating enzyme n=1 Tax=Thiobaca trueperi TaxID=127458 RepID=A0A4V6P015_9GAMM|nr:radical SAM protein [Thiobaca trueperi]TCT24282.1 pyruvate-formate lyase-activating enzyme [Thiobaca trueperi]
MPEGRTGACGRYINDKGTLTERYPDTYLVVCPISAETMPVMHFHPGAKFLQISTTGCNFNCSGCVASVVAKEIGTDSKALKRLTPQQVIGKALDEECIGIVFLMNDPLASFHTFLAVARTAKAQGLLVGCSSNGYFTQDSADALSPYLDFINVGIKGLSDADYKCCGAPGYAPVLRNIRDFHEAGIHVEAACMHKKGEDDVVMAIAATIADIADDIPLQIMRFIPVDDADIGSEPSVRESEQIQRMASKRLKYVYLFNAPGTDCINTYCPECGQLIVERDFYGPMGSKLRRSLLSADERHCPQCGYALEIKGAIATGRYDENDFEGGYPFTRALEIIEGTLAAIGVKDQGSIARCWEHSLQENGLQKLHGSIQGFERYADSIRRFGALTGKESEAARLISYMDERVQAIGTQAARIETRPRVYYAMSTPLFALEYERLENGLVELAGGASINKALATTGRPGMKVTPDALNALDPEVIFISAFMQAPLEDFYADCDELGIRVEAVRNKRIYNHPIPCIDFGSPRWILGLMHIAQCLHPDRFSFDIEAEAKVFYREFYGLEFRLEDVNRSFAKPSKRWRILESG